MSKQVEITVVELSNEAHSHRNPTHWEVGVWQGSQLLIEKPIWCSYEERLVVAKYVARKYGASRIIESALTS